MKEKLIGLSRQQELLWTKCLPLLEIGRVDDLDHAYYTTKFVLDYDGSLEMNKNILVPVAMMHDIGHSAILPEHFKLISGPQKIKNGKIVHLLAGAKIASTLLSEVGYSQEMNKKIVDIITISDYDQLDIGDWRQYYDTHNKKVFHDLDALDRYTSVRLKHVMKRYDGKDKIIEMLTQFLDNFFFKEFKEIAKNRLKQL